MGRVTGAAGSDSITYKGDSEPLYIWNNTGQNTPSIGEYPDGQGDSCSGTQDFSSNYIVQNRDYFVGVPKPGYTKYTYPHPQRT
jgi:hypothetical protein